MLVARWNDLPATPLIAVNGRVVGLNANPFSNDASVDGWDNATDGTRLLTNLILFKGVVKPSCSITIVCFSN
jgi:hypothetical protein